MDDMVQVLDSFVEPGSELWLYNEVRSTANTWLKHNPGMMHLHRAGVLVTH